MKKGSGVWCVGLELKKKKTKNKPLLNRGPTIKKHKGDKDTFID